MQGTLRNDDHLHRLRRQREQETSRTATASQQDTLPLEERDPLSTDLLRAIEAEIAAITGAPRDKRARVTVLGRHDFEVQLERLVPPRLRARGLASHMRVLVDPADHRHVYVGPSALAGLNDGHSNVITDLLYQLIGASGGEAPLAFERAVADLTAAELAKRLNLRIFDGYQYPEETAMVSSIIEAIREWDEEPADLVALLARAPRSFMQRLKASSFYEWWISHVAADPQTAMFVQLIATMTHRSVRLDPQFLSWAASCAGTYAVYRATQRSNALAGAAKRSTSPQDETAADREEPGTVTRAS